MYSDWTTTFFRGLAVEFWDKIAPAPSGLELDFLRSIFGGGGEILDVACGSGRYSIPLAAHGYRVAGVDISDDFLALAKRRDPSIEWHHCDIRELPWTARFDGAMCFGNSFGYFDREQTRAFLARLANAMKRGARFVLETAATAESLLPSLQRERRIEVGDIIFSSRNRYDATDSRLEIEYSFARGDARETSLAQTFIFTTGEVAAMLTAAGFEVEGLYASAAREPFVLGAPKAIFIARCTGG